MRWKAFAISIFLGCLFVPLMAQIPSTLVPDAGVLQWKDIETLINANHPVIKQAGLSIDQAREDLRISRGGFDPKLETKYSRKEFKETTYYNIWEGKLKVPLWLGEVRGGYDKNLGTFLNPERTTPDQDGQLSFGVTLPLLKGLMTDPRRNTLRQAQAFQNIARAEQRKMVNKLMFEANKAYWNWYYFYRQAEYLDSAYQLTSIRFEGIKRNIRLGELPAVDSVEAKIILQTRSIQLREARVDAQNARLILGTFLWSAQNEPIEIAEQAIPEQPELVGEVEGFEWYLQRLRLEHPELEKLRYKQTQMKLNERLYRNQLLPQVDVSYDLIRNIDTQSSEGTDFRATENYKVGLNFSFPILLRKTRGKLRQTQFKIRENEFDQAQTTRSLEISLLALDNSLQNLESLIAQQADMVQNYRLLYRSELRKFRVGESTVFLVNARESKLIESQIKLIALWMKYKKTDAEIIYTAGGPDWFTQ